MAAEEDESEVAKCEKRKRKKERKEMAKRRTPLKLRADRKEVKRDGWRLKNYFFLFLSRPVGTLNCSRVELIKLAKKEKKKRRRNGSIEKGCDFCRVISFVRPVGR